MDVNPFHVHYQRKQETKRQQFRPVLRALVEGVASLVEGQRCFAEEFGLSYGRVFHDDLESFKGKNTSKVIAEWLRSGEAGADMLRNLFNDLAQHQMALVEAADEVARESMDMGTLSKSRLADMFGMDANDESGKSKYKQDMQQRLIMTAFVTCYARSREGAKAKPVANLDAEAVYK